MSHFSFYHIADLHLDSPFRSVSKSPPLLRDSLVSAPLNAFKKMVAAAIAEKIAFVLISGDIFDQATVSLKIEHEFFACIESLSEHDIGVFIIYGNHDSEFFLTKRGALEKLANIHFFPETELVGSFELPALQTVIYGMNFSNELTTQFLLDPPNKNVFTIGLYHGDIFASPTEESTAYGNLRKNDLLKSKIDYWALGHLHQFNVANEFPHLVYPGTPQGRSMKPAECGDKGCVKVKVENNRVKDVQFFPLSDIAYLGLEVELESKYSSTLELFNEIKQGIIAEIDENPPLKSPNIILRINLRIAFLSDSETFSYTDQTQITDLLSKEIFKSKTGNRYFPNGINWTFKPVIDSEIQREIFELSSEILETELDKLSVELMTQLLKPKLKMKDLEILDPNSLKEEVINQIKRLTVG